MRQGSASAEQRDPIAVAVGLRCALHQSNLILQLAARSFESITHGEN